MSVPNYPIKWRKQAENVLNNEDNNNKVKNYLNKKDKSDLFIHSSIYLAIFWSGFHRIQHYFWVMTRICYYSYNPLCILQTAASKDKVLRIQSRCVSSFNCDFTYFIIIAYKTIFQKLKIPTKLYKNALGLSNSTTTFIFLN